MATSIETRASGRIVQQLQQDSREEQIGSLLCPCHVKDWSLEVEEQEEPRGHCCHSDHGPPHSLIWQDAYKGNGDEDAQCIACASNPTHCLSQRARLEACTITSPVGSHASRATFLSSNQRVQFTATGSSAGPPNLQHALGQSLAHPQHSQASAVHVTSQCIYEAGAHRICTILVRARPQT